MSASNQHLNELIDRWCEEHLGAVGSSVSEERLDELKDHLACVAEAQIEQGATAGDAMAYAAEQFGDAREVRDQLASTLPVFRRWLARIHCKSASVSPPQEKKTVLMSLVFAAVLLISAWLAKDSQSHAFISTVIIAVWVVLTSRQGGTREAARAEWRWLKRKLGF